MAVALHPIKNATDWPLSIKDFAQSLCRPLPSVFMPHVGTVADFEDFARAAKPPPASQTERNLLNLSNIISWTVRDLHHLSRHKALDDGPQSTLFPIYNLLKVLAHVLEPTLKVATDVPFLTPRGSHQLEGVAFAVVSHVVSKGDRPQAQAEEHDARSDELHGDEVVGAEGEEEPAEEEAAVNRWELDTEGREAYDANHPMWDTPCDFQPPTRHYEIYGPFARIYDSNGDDTKSETESSIDLTPEAHVEAVSSRRTHAVLPIIFAADQDNILLLSSSVLYHRKVWGIDLPVVGICISADSSVVRLCLSWLDADALNEAGLPRVHTAVAAEGVEDASVGMFDLGSVSGALSFAQAVLELRDQRRVVAAASKDNATTSFSWRSDNISIGEPPLEERVSQWLLDVDVQTPRGLEGSDAILSDQAPPPTDDDNMPRKDEAPTFRLKQASVQSPMSSPATSENANVADLVEEPRASASTANPGSQYLSPPSAGRSASRSTKIRAVQSAPSLSQLADNKSESIVEETMAAFLSDRNVCFVSTNSFDNISRDTGKSVSGMREDVALGQSMVGTYKKMIRFGWPAPWASNPDESVPLTYCIDDAREILCSQYKVLPDEIKNSDLEPEIYEVIRERIVFPLLASVGQYTKDKELSKPRTVNEAEFRHDWDSLLQHLYVSGQERISHNVMLERRLQTCRNQHFDRFIEDHDRWVQRAYLSAWMHYRFCSDELSLAMDAMQPGPTLDGGPSDSAMQTYLRATWETNAALLRSELIRNNSSGDKANVLLSLLKTRVTRETIAGTCDAVAVDPVSLDDVDDEVVAKYRSFMQPQWSAHIQRDDQGQALITGFETFVPTEGDNTKKNTIKKTSNKNDDMPAKSGLDNVDGLDLKLKRDPTLTEAMDHALRKSTPEGDRTPSDPFPLATSTLSTATPEVLQFEQRPSATTEHPRLCDVWIPTTFVKYKKRNDDSPKKAVGQAHSYLCSGLNFMDSVGIRNHPVMGLVTNGTRGAIIMGWKSFHTGITYILERSISIFDLSVPIQAYHFGIVLVRLRLWAKQQREELKKKVVKHFTDTPAEQLQKWTKEAQVLQHFELHNPTPAAASAPAPAANK